MLCICFEPRKRFICFLATLGLIISLASPAFGADTEDMTNGYTEEFLASAYDNSISFITLEDDVYISSNEYIQRDQPLTVEMGDYAFILTSDLFIAGPAPIFFEGNGNVQPLFQIQGGMLSNSTEVCITAREDEAVAVWFDAGAIADTPEFRFGPVGATAAMRISANGDRAVALDAVGAVDLTKYGYPPEHRVFPTLDISATGSGGIGIRYEDSYPICILLSSIHAGGASVQANNAEIYVDSSTLSPNPQSSHVNISCRVAEWGNAYSFHSNLYPYGVWTYVGEEPKPDSRLDFQLLQYDGDDLVSTIYTPYPVTWTFDRENVDTVGVHEIIDVPTLPVAGVDVVNLAHGIEHKIPWYVVEQGKPYLTHAARSNETSDSDIEISVLGELHREYTLYMRESDGDEWSALPKTRSSYSVWSGKITVFNQPYDTAYQFMLQVEGIPAALQSNIIYLPAGRDFTADLETIRILLTDDGENLPPQRPVIDEEGRAECQSASDLIWLLEREDVRQIVLTRDMVINHSLKATLSVPITVEQGSYSITLLGDLYLEGGGQALFRGDGSQKPLFVFDGGILSGHEDVGIVATGDDAVAIRIDQPYRGYSPVSAVRIQADGARSTAIHVPADSTSVGATPVDSIPAKSDGINCLYSLLDISAAGEGGVGIRIEDEIPVTIRLCRIIAASQALVCGSGTEVQSCILEPAVQNVQLVTLTAAWEWQELVDFGNFNLYHYGFWVLPGQRPVVAEVQHISLYKAQKNNQGSECSISVPMEWDFSGVNFHEPGQYDANATPILPIPGLPIYHLDEKQNKIAVYVAQEGLQYLTRAYKSRSPKDSISIHLMTDMGDVNFRLWHRTGDAPWSVMEMDGNACRYWPSTTDFNGSITVFGIDLDVDHLFRLEILEGPMKGQTNVLVVPGGFEFHPGGSGGDRGGADQEQQKPPDIEQPAPNSGGSKSNLGGFTPNPGGFMPNSPGVLIVPESVHQAPSLGSEGIIPQTPAGDDESISKPVVRDPAQEEMMMEYSTENTISISGFRLKEMLALAKDTVLFEKQGVSIELAADFLAGLNVADRSRFTVRIERGDNGFTLEILLDDVPLSAIPSTIVYVPFSPIAGMDGENLACFDVQGQEVSMAIYDAVRQIVRVEIQTTGSYIIGARGAAPSPVPAQMADGNVGGAPFDGAGGDLGGGGILAIIGIAAALWVCFVILRRRIP